MNRKPRKQASNLPVGSRFILPVTLAFEVVESSVIETGVSLKVIPVPCSEHCPSNCDCDTEFLLAAEGPFVISVDANRKLEYIGNLHEELQAIEAMQARIKRLQAGNEQQSAEAQTGDAMIPDSDAFA